jgi:hypothetical protein
MSNVFMNGKKPQHNDNYYNQQIGISGQSFDGDSLPDYSEFDTESVTLQYFKER